MLDAARAQQPAARLPVTVNGKRIKIFAIKDPAEIDWPGVGAGAGPAPTVAGALLGAAPCVPEGPLFCAKARVVAPKMQNAATVAK
jgi:hypothetical protein